MRSHGNANGVLFAMVAVSTLLLPTVSAATAPRDIVASGAGDPHGASPASFQPYPSSLYNDPGAPYGYPDHDTFGYTVESKNQSRWFDYDANDTTGANVIVDMGHFNRMQSTAAHFDYWADVAFDARLRMWDDNDGHYEPNTSHAGPGQVAMGCASGLHVCIGDDDPCIAGEFPIMDVYASSSLQPSAQDVLIRTVYGGNMTGCSGVDRSEAHTFTILPDPDYPGEPAGRFHIPKWVLGYGFQPERECFVRLRFVPRDLDLPHHAPGHNASDDGFSINITSVMVQLVAPPMVILHGYSAGINPQIEVLQNQRDLAANLRQAMVQNFGQDPWEWAADMPGEGIYLHSYDRKQDFRVSAAELAALVEDLYEYRWAGKIWMHGQSMGGLVARYYIEHLGGDDRVAKLAQTGTPNTGSWEPMIYTYLFEFFYAIEDNTPINRHLLWPPVPPCPFAVFGVPPIWKQWDTAAPGNVWTYHCGAPHGRSRMADFELRPANLWLNSILHFMNAQYLGMPDDFYPPYFSVRASLPITPGFDGAVSIDSASLNGAIRTRTIKAFHEDIPSQPQTAVYFSRFFGDLNLDTAYPEWCTPHETRVAHVINNPADPGDVINPNAGPDYVGNATENATFEMYLSTKGAIPFDNSSDVTPVPTDSSGNPVLIGNERVRVPIDALGPARITLHTPLDLPALHLSLDAPGGAAARAEYREDTHGWTRVQQFTLPAPSPGEYWLNIGPTAYATPFVVLGSWESPHRFTLATDKPSYAPGEPVTLRATLTGLGPNTVADVVAYVPTQEGPRGALPMKGANGTYTATWTAPMDAGTFPVSVTAQGYTTVATAGGRAKAGTFLRDLPLYVLVQAPAGKPIDPGSGTPEDTPGTPVTGKPTGQVPLEPVRTNATGEAPPTSVAEKRDVPGLAAALTLTAILAVTLVARSRTRRNR